MAAAQAGNLCRAGKRLGRQRSGLRLGASDASLCVNLTSWEQIVAFVGLGMFVLGRLQLSRLALFLQGVVVKIDKTRLRT